MAETTARRRRSSLLRLTPATTDLIDIVAERNRRTGHGPTTRSDVVRDAVAVLAEQATRRSRRHNSETVTEAQEEAR